MAGFKYNGKRLAYFSYWKDHCALYGTGTGTIKFSADTPPSDRLVTRLVKTRIAQIEKAQPRVATRYGGHATVDDYLAAVPKDVRAALGKLRKTIKAAAPRVTEGISYQVPVFKLDGKLLVGFGAATAHCTFFVMSTSAAMRARLAELTSLSQPRS